MCQSSWNWRCLFPCYNECCIKAISLVYRPYNPHLLHFRVILFWNLGYLNAYQKTHYLPNLQKNVSFYMVYPILVCKRTASWSTNIRTILKTLQFLLYPVYSFVCNGLRHWCSSLQSEPHSHNQNGGRIASILYHLFVEPIVISLNLCHNEKMNKS